MPWTPEEFRRHNHEASPHQLEVGAERANAVLRETGDEGAAVRAGNAAIKAMRHNARRHITEAKGKKHR